MGRQVITENEPVWRALADPTRRKILDLLRDGPRTTGELCAHFPTSRYTIMGHIEVLHAVGILTFERRGRERLNHLNPVPLLEACQRWLRPFSAEAAAFLLNLADDAEKRETPVTGLSIDIRAEHLVQRPADATWRSLMQMERWWPRCWKEGETLSFEPRLGGRLAVVSAPGEPGGEAGGTLWGAVERFEPGARLAVRGAMGLPGPVVGVWDLELIPRGQEATRVVLVHQAFGPVSDEDRQCFREGWDGMLSALARFAEEA
ncbi:helix-turn-helix domain-containing protein [Gellertiella hungarica]|uniref:DNA-binding transcriptional ArsR family regulator/uncharacterized protein YndB with AHSA1/START domain n=1 Tax=Gellertiella hungarica TaxID=1572859 RepID=A0A7W6NJ27_9HYPH|nr:helix-turn-helix domain-containing protein [Gellertiella hungarica]MBB4062872.1 DNA-binding transcriptional ArsR family regulator/uncharacterized protein YndB with AHSA1/START domain [Gellertiella hungarica]